MQEPHEQYPVPYRAAVPRIEIDTETLGALNFEAAASIEGNAGEGLLPRTIVDEVLVARSPELGRLLTAQLAHGLAFTVPEVLSVSKPSRGRRPVVVLPPRERVLYRALTDALGEAVPVPNRDSETFEAFKAAPLDSPQSRFVSMTDVAACYQYIDHEVIHEELISRTADPFLSSAIVGFLQGVGGQRFGMPQNREASHRLAELILDIPERALRRKGYQIWRYNDDFRIATHDRPTAHEALEDLEVALRGIGLTLNDEKTSVKSRESYSEWASATDDRLAEVQEAASFDIAGFDYDGDILELDRVGVMTSSAIRLLELWQDDLTNDRNRYGPEAVVGRQMLSIALGVLGAVGDEAGLAHCPAILQSEPSRVSVVAKYMRSLMGGPHETEVDRTYEAILDPADSYLSAWHSLWLLEPLRRSIGLTPRQTEWLGVLVRGRSDYVRAAAACVLSSEGLADIGYIAQVFDSSSAASKPLLVQAMVEQEGDLPSGTLEATLRDDQLFGWVRDIISQRR
jgi:hypothetical protein